MMGWRTSDELKEFLKKQHLNSDLPLFPKQAIALPAIYISITILSQKQENIQSLQKGSLELITKHKAIYSTQPYKSLTFSNILFFEAHFRRPLACCGGFIDLGTKEVRTKRAPYSVFTKIEACKIEYFSLVSYQWA